jgi:hypothetical protein
MRKMHPFFLLFLLVAGASAQVPVNSSAASDVLVIEKNWHMVFQAPLYNDEDPFQANNDANQAQRDIKENIRQNAIRARSGLPAQAPPIRVRPIKIGSSPASSSAIYIYEVKVKNLGDKTIRGVTLEYVFLEETTNREVGRHRFFSKTNISPGKTKNLVMRSISPPAGSINAAQAGKKLRDQYAEQIVILSIEYADGSVR